MTSVSWRTWVLAGGLLLATGCGRGAATVATATAGAGLAGAPAAGRQQTPTSPPPAVTATPAPPATATPATPPPATATPPPPPPTATPLPPPPTTATPATAAAPAPAPADLTIEIVEPELANPNTWGFAPKTITVPSGTAVTWVNKGIIGHTVAVERSESQLLMQGDTFQYTFRTPGDVAYTCGIHPWMQATVVVAGGG